MRAISLNDGNANLHGLFVQLHGLATSELNGKFVELLGRKMDETTGEFQRWSCRDYSSSRVMLIKPNNLRILDPSSLPEDEVRMLLAAADDVHRVFYEMNRMPSDRRTQALKDYTAYLKDLISRYPWFGPLHRILADCLHRSQARPIEICDAMRRSIVNIGTSDPVARFADRTNYAGALASSGDSEGELRELLCMLSEGMPEGLPPSSVFLFKLNLAQSLQERAAKDIRASNTTSETDFYTDEAFRQLLQLQDAPLIPSECPGGVSPELLDQEVKKCLQRVSGNYFTIGQAIEKQGDDVFQSGGNPREIWERAREYHDKSYKACPTERASVNAVMRIQAKLSQAFVQVAPNVFVNTSDEAVVLSTPDVSTIDI